MTESDELYHYGILRRSGRYPWGTSGWGDGGTDTPYERSSSFFQVVDAMRKSGMSDTDIARSLEMKTTDFRATASIAREQKRAGDTALAIRLKDKGMSNTAIGERMGINESSVRALLSNAVKTAESKVVATTTALKGALAKTGLLDVGSGTEAYLGVSQTQLETALAALRDEGLNVYNIKVKQMTTGKYTTQRILAPESVTYGEVYRSLDKIGTVNSYSDDGGSTFTKVKYPESLSSSRVGIKYGDEGGSEADGMIYIRPGVEDLSLGSSNYAQVRILVDGTHYIKGVAVYKSDLPNGVDVQFNTSKSNTGTKLDALKEISTDKDNPFTASITRQSGKMNIVNEEGDWSTWSHNLSSQVLSKQSVKLAEEQLGLSYSIRKIQFDELNALTNPAVKSKLMILLADDLDASAVSLKAAGLPREAAHVIIPVNSLKDTEIYAPNYRDGESVVLIRHPHGGIFEIPELTVNNKNVEGRKLLKQAPDAVGINASIAKRLSGADFDGDTVLVIPNNNKKIATSKPLEGLKNFDPQVSYPGYEGMPKLKPEQKQKMMGQVTNLIADMTIKGADQSELARAVRHSMVVIDAEKHNLNYKQSEIDNGIASLKIKYQGKDGQPGTARSGASTIVTRAKGRVDVPERTPRSYREGGPIDPTTGEKIYTETGATRTSRLGTQVLRTTKTTKMAETKDAKSLSSGMPIEEVYAEYANRVKALANAARKAAVTVKPTPYSKQAATVYAKEVETLSAKLKVAQKNAPLERQAQLKATVEYKKRIAANPDMEKDTASKLRATLLIEARIKVGAQRKATLVEITPSEWSAIQAGAVSSTKLSQILTHTDLDQVKKYATPRENPVMTKAITSRAKQLLSAGYTQAEVADVLGIPVSTIVSAMNR